MRVFWGLVIVFLVALWSVWPMLQNPSRVPDIGSDGVLIIWIMNQQRLFEGTNFYPYHNTLAYSDRFLLSELSTRLPVLLTYNPAVAFGFAMIFGQVLTMVLIYQWWSYLFKSPTSAAIAAIAFGLSQIRFEYQVHLQMWSMQYWLLGLLLIWRKPTKINIYLGFILLGLQFWESPLPVYFAITVLLLMPQRWTKHHLVGLVLMGLIIFPMAKAYLGVSREFHFERDIREAAHNAISIDDLWGHFASFGLYILAAFALLLRPKKVNWLWGILIISLLLAFGPALKWQGKTIKVFHLPIPMPYAPAYYLVPGFGGLRTPSRWLFLTAFAMSGIIAAGLAKHRFSKIDILACLAIAILEGTLVTHVKDIPSPANYPAVYQWLESQPGKIVLELPAYTWPHEATETYRMLYNLEDNKTLVNGYSGFTPPLPYQLAKTPFVPVGVDYVVVHKDEGEVGKIKGRLVWQNETTSVYSVH